MKNVGKRPYRKSNFLAEIPRSKQTVCLSYEVADALERAAKAEGRSASWLAEDIIATALDVKPALRRIKSAPVMPRFSSAFLPEFGEDL